MQKNILIVFALALAFIGLAYFTKHEKQLVDVVGIPTEKKVTAPHEVKSISHQGAFSGKNATYNDAQFYGATNLDNVVINGDLQVYGAADFKDVHVKGNATLFGATSAQVSTFTTIKLGGQLTVHNTTINTIEVVENKSKKIQTIELFNSTVSGDIIFSEKRPGKVIIHKGSRVQGTITHAQVIRD